MVMCAKSQLDHWTRFEPSHFSLKPSNFSGGGLQNIIWIKRTAWCFPVTDNHVNDFFQIWIIADKVPGLPTERSGTICHRLGVRPMQPKGLSWDFGIAVSFHIVYHHHFPWYTWTTLVRLKQIFSASGPNNSVVTRETIN